MKIYREHFAVLPFKYDTGIAMEEDEVQQKIPYLPSYVIHEKEIDPTIRNVIDFKFLYGYVEPTLAILYEPDQTFAGRLAHRKDTVCLVVVSLDIFQKAYPVLYKVTGLPYNCTRIEAVPSPVGGVIVLSNNALIHIDQTHTPGFAAIVNPFFDLESHFKPIPTDDGTPPIPVKNKPPSVYMKYAKYSNCKELGISLDGARCTFINPDTLLLAIRSGEMYQVDLIGDDGAGRSWNRKRGGVRDIKIRGTGLTMCPCTSLFSLLNVNGITKPQILGSLFDMDGLRYYSNFLFAGSAVADAMLVQFVEPIDSVETQDASLQMEIDAEDELDAELYGNATTQSVARKPLLLDENIKYRVCDSLLVTGPLRNVVLGQPAPYSPYEYTGDPQDSHLEIVACGGHDTHGSLVILHQSIRPVIVSSFSLGKIDDMFAVEPNMAMTEDGFHRYLIISRESGTNVSFV
jgi:cleavage and polyadenylation specificity factor subunit 1